MANCYLALGMIAEVENPVPCVGCGVQGAGSRVQGAGCGVWGAGCGVHGCVGGWASLPVRMLDESSETVSGGSHAPT